MSINANKWPKKAREIADNEFRVGRTAPYVTERLQKGDYPGLPALAISKYTVAAWLRTFNRNHQWTQIPRRELDLAARSEARARLLHDMADHMMEKLQRKVQTGKATPDDLGKMCTVCGQIERLQPKAPRTEGKPNGAQPSEEEKDATSSFMEQLEQAAAKPRRRANKPPSHQRSKKEQQRSDEDGQGTHGAEDGERDAVPSGAGVEGQNGQAGGSS